ncbi:GTPase [Candidatus Protochlamydia amoebophila]|uniref:Uncharacterized protein n=1 Tax=Protochlamydia amoebophila (strain UWE25) TaxID=264201 RepID=Q6MB09_PARUW|nr:GTPase [Candidatus Protochlamydia amoebophila]CAF24240.1 unnamed protein product [Candidatus Protochlamydia amoebophila UWE25]
MITLNSSYTAIADIVRNDNIGGILKKAEATVVGGKVQLYLGDSMISYLPAIDAIFQQAGVNSEPAKKLLIVFRKYKLGVINASKLQRKIEILAIPYTKEISEIIQSRTSHPKPFSERLDEILASNDFQNTYGLQLTASQIHSKIAKICAKYKTISLSALRAQKLGNIGEKQEDINAKVDELFEAGLAASAGANGQNVVVFVGNTGVGKSTTINFLLKRELKSIPKEVLGIESVIENVIIAKDPATSIGHKRISKTSYPLVVQDPDNQLAYCDCPGFRDTRGKSVEIYNALSIIGVLDKAKSVRGFLFFIDCFALKASRGQAIIDDMRFLFLLLQDFKIHQRAVLFVITKTMRADKLHDIKKVLQDSVEEILQDGNQSIEFRIFCGEIAEANFLDNAGLGQRVFICDPCGPNAKGNREEILRTINAFSYDTNIHKKFGYPISEKVESKLDMSRNSIIFQVQKTLTVLKNKLGLYWDEQTEKIKTEIDKVLVEKTRAYLDEIKQWQKDLKQELSHFASGNYVKVSKELTDTLTQSLVYWDKLNQISTQKTNMENLDDHFEGIVKELQSIQSNIEILWHKRMHEVIKKTFEQSLQTYQVQNKLDDMRKSLPPKKLADLTVKELRDLLQTLADAAKVALEYPNFIEAILIKDPNKCKDLIEIIRVNLMEPIHVVSNQQVLNITANAQAVTLSEILKNTHDLLNSTREIWITQIATLYFNSELTADHFKGKVIYIAADQIEVVQDSLIDLAVTWRRGGVITLKGHLKGEEKFENAQFKLVPKDQVSDTVRLIKCQWPLS